VSSCSKCSKRSRRQSAPPVPLSPPTKEKLVEWLFSHNKQHPSELAEAALAAKGMSLCLVLQLLEMSSTVL